MKAVTLAKTKTMKLIKVGLSFFRRSFDASKCKTAAKMAVARIKLLRNKREVVVRQMRRDIALLLYSGQDATARIRVEHVIREQNMLAANEIIELFCELVVNRLGIIAKRRECPADLKEGVASLIFAAPRCSEIPELTSIRDVFEKKYGKDFVSAATDLRPNSGVNRLLIEKLSVRTPNGEVKLKFMKEIAKEHKIEWDPGESEKELLKPPEELIEGPRTFVSAASLPVNPSPNLSSNSNNATLRSSNGGEKGAIKYQDTALAAEAAAESARQAIAAAEAAAILANKNTGQFDQSCTFDSHSRASGINHGFVVPSTNNASWEPGYQSMVSGRMFEAQSSGRSHQQRSEDLRPAQMDSADINGRCSSHHVNAAFQNHNLDLNYSEEKRPGHMNGREAYRRHSYNVNSANPDTKFNGIEYGENTGPNHIHEANAFRRHSYNVPPARFDGSNYEEDSMEDPGGSNLYPAQRPSPPPKQNYVPRVHPKLPDYDELAARFEAAKYHKK